MRANVLSGREAASRELAPKAIGVAGEGDSKIGQGLGVAFDGYRLLAVPDRRSVYGGAYRRTCLS